MEVLTYLSETIGYLTRSNAIVARALVYLGQMLSARWSNLALVEVSIRQ